MQIGIVQATFEELEQTVLLRGGEGQRLEIR